MKGFSSNLNDTFTSSRGCAEPVFFPQHILPLLPLYNAQWWGYESLTAIVLVSISFHLICSGVHHTMTTSSLQHNYVKVLFRYTLTIRSLHKYIIFEVVCLCKLTVELLIIISILTLGAIADIF